MGIGNNPVCLSALGVAPLVVISKSLLTGAFIGAVFVITLMITAVVISSTRSLIPNFTRLVYILILSTTCVTVLSLSSQALFYNLSISADIYLPLIAMNSLILFYLETEALKNKPINIISSALHVSVLIMLICLLVGGVSELLSQGGVFLEIEGINSSSASGIKLMPDIFRMSIFNTASGALIITGCVLSLIKYVNKRFLTKKQNLPPVVN
jgi:Na+-translocating ferredoxin:NAD+ oxidoreductase subunit E